MFCFMAKVLILFPPECFKCNGIYNDTPNKNDEQLVPDLKKALPFKRYFSHSIVKIREWKNFTNRLQPAWKGFNTEKSS